MGRRIVWQKWVNPLGGGAEWADADRAGGRPRPAAGFADDDDDMETAMVRPVVPTPAGMVPVRVYGSLADAFTFLVAHTDFSITPGIARAVERVEGVETLDVLTRYRMRVGIGHAFNVPACREAVERAVGVYRGRAGEVDPGAMELDAATGRAVDRLQSFAASVYPHWALLVLPNGSIDFSHAGHEELLRDRLRLYHDVRRVAGGMLITSDELHKAPALPREQ